MPPSSSVRVPKDGRFSRTQEIRTIPAGPAVPGGRQVQLLRLAGTPTGDVALLQTGTGGAATQYGSSG